VDGASPVKVVLRLIKMDKASAAKILSFEELGYTKDHAASFRDMINKPVGVIIVAGETGSGKSTTLANAIRGVIKDNSRNGVPEISVYTLEEPVETLIPGADQVPVSGKGAMAKAMRNVLRLDPDVIMVGEVRDQETAELMATAVQSGHKVLTTVHTSSALEVPGRLIGQQLRLPLDLIASPNFIAGLIFQRLLPVLCGHCKRPLQATDLAHSGELRERELYERLKRVGADEGNTLFTRGAGCPRCGNTGYKGRTVCAEVVLPDNTMLKHWAHGNLFDAIEYWRSTQEPNNPDSSQGRTALEHALTKMMAGKICPHDVEHGFGNLDTDARSASAASAEKILYDNTPIGSEMMKAS
jgi:type II secretory ATPase GspE/PulE/Tfp pilus assembly ATPase PilB-like protein